MEVWVPPACYQQGQQDRQMRQQMPQQLPCPLDTAISQCPLDRMEIIDRYLEQALAEASKAKAKFNQDRSPVIAKPLVQSGKPPPGFPVKPVRSPQTSASSKPFSINFNILSIEFNSEANRVKKTQYQASHTREQKLAILNSWKKLMLERHEHIFFFDFLEQYKRQTLCPNQQYSPPSVLPIVSPSIAPIPSVAPLLTSTNKHSPVKRIQQLTTQEPSSSISQTISALESLANSQALAALEAQHTLETFLESDPNHDDGSLTPSQQVDAFEQLLNSQPSSWNQIDSSSSTSQSCAPPSSIHTDLLSKTPILNAVSKQPQSTNQTKSPHEQLFSELIRTIEDPVKKLQYIHQF
ncbi:hypothetical protein F0562_003604 [Nyssa sinensis]|uniref:DUF7588 domain-containing protein n=1 Tax=Nyssa sinensis TaxID=561372 RepID=A0A5J5BZU9_9ASTE|nr:hypothetical protein F0562_003604 [Nyssa sinensis]